MGTLEWSCWHRHGWSKGQFLCCTVPYSTFYDAERWVGGCGVGAQQEVSGQISCKMTWKAVLLCFTCEGKQFSKA